MKDYVDMLIDLALNEDLEQTGDVTSLAIFKNEKDTFQLIAKDEGILCGKDIFIKTMHHVDSSVMIDFYYSDKDKIKKGVRVATITGSVLSILTAERTALNFLGHLSGIASKTALFVQKTNNQFQILDTRKTLPAYRNLQKYAVSCGGGTNHRFGLYDMVMIKDNHIDAAGSITRAVQLVRDKWADQYKIEVETRNILEVKEALQCNVDRIMLDNMSLDMVIDAVRIIKQKAEIELSGNMNLDKISLYQDHNINYISVGELTHSVKAFDFSLKKTGDHK
ncbi:MAG: carboxylating nicotinate-nucleotide diphosphorylase [Spirochaetes bacterium]|nr:carboxylating nicotinate-nucleotide diphosphorylase [Spirochaetota bacterium]